MTVSLDPNLFLSSIQQKRTAKSDTLGKDDFLKILMTQLQNQDPLNPLQDKDFIAQMATFSTLEQITNLATSFDRWANEQKQNQMIQMNQFVGKEISWHKVVDEDQLIVEEGTGVIQSIRYKGDYAEFILEDGTVLKPENISEVHQPIEQESNLLLQGSLMIGRNVTWMNDQEERTGVIQAVSVKSGILQLKLDNGDEITLDEVIFISQ
ncbi:MAG: flagellar hook assembly protein FlgD [Bacillus sp. (in: Bacteria)]|nr:flagellar hook assembly protein FlgD [Bacillus sp. (in: firmicutes)]